jgi:hypothetical protein
MLTRESEPKRRSVVDVIRNPEAVDLGDGDAGDRDFYAPAPESTGLGVHLGSA